MSFTSFRCLQAVYAVCPPDALGFLLWSMGLDLSTSSQCCQIERVPPHWASSEHIGMEKNRFVQVVKIWAAFQHLVDF